jgi:AcrR family transcriptional regulator
MATKHRTTLEGASKKQLTQTPNGLAREQVSDIQRARILAAMVDVAAERGAANVTVAHVVARSGVSRRTFYELFEDRETCFLAAFEEAVKRAVAAVGPAYELPGPWRAKIRSALVALLAFLDHEPGVGRLLVVETLGAGPRALERRQDLLLLVIEIVDRGRSEARKGDGPPPLTAEGLVGAVLSIVHTRMAEEQGPPLVGMTNPLMSMIVLPYLGPAAARRELEQPTVRHALESKNGTNPLRDLEMRLTYRTVRVLMAVGSQSGVSNRRVADAAGVSDQGQISKLLARLESLGLIENSGFGHAKGESNSWHLTARGREIEQAIIEQTNRS